MSHPARDRGDHRHGRFRVGVVSAGRVGSVLGAALDAVGHEVVAVCAVSDESRRRAAQWLPRAAVLPADEVVRHADLVLLAVPDDQLEPLVRGLAVGGMWRRGQVVVHTSGARGLAVLAPAAAAGALGLAVHPALSITARPEDARRLAGARFGVTAPLAYRPLAEALVLEVEGEPVWVPDEARPAYHAALALGANHLVTLVNDAADLLAAAGVEDGRALLAPLLGGALDNALRLGDAALTGPVQRGDGGTVARHRGVLAERAPEMLGAYESLARRTAARAVAAGRLDPAGAVAVLDALAGPSDPVGESR